MSPKAAAAPTLDDVLAQAKAGKLPPVVLLTGDDYLCKTAVQSLTNLLVDESFRTLNVVELDAGAGPRRVADEVATLPMFRSAKVISVQPAEFLAPRKSSKGNPFAKALDLWGAGKNREATRRVLALAGRAGFALAELDRASRDRWQEAGFEVDREALELIGKAVELARAEGLEIPESDARPLEALLEAGLPAGHFLLMVAEEMDPKSALVRLALEHGLALACELPAQSAGFGRRETHDVGGLAKQVLASFGKTLSAEAAAQLGSAGLDARGLTNELEKLASFVGERGKIELGDVRELVVDGLGEDLFAVSHAVEERDRNGLVTAIDDETTRGAVPLQILGSLASAVRGLLAARARLAALGMERRFSFQDFERRAAPAFAEADKRAGRKPGHPFRAFKRAEASLRYSLQELSRLLRELADADAGIKRGMDGRLWLVRIAAKL